MGWFWLGLLRLETGQQGRRDGENGWCLTDALLIFLYRPVELNQDNIECVLELSVRFAVGMLIEQCCNFLASAVAVDTACAILILADVSCCNFHSYFVVSPLSVRKS